MLRKAGDRLSHEFLTHELAVQRPGDVVLSEEGADNPARLTARRVWIVDPLDGTREFGEPGRTDWAVHVALWESGSDASAPGDLTAGAVALPAQGGSCPRPPRQTTANAPPMPHTTSMPIGAARAGRPAGRRTRPAGRRTRPAGRRTRPAGRPAGCASW